MNASILFIFSLIFSLSSKLPAQKPTAADADIAKQVSNIKVQYLAIDAKRKTYNQYEPMTYGSGLNAAEKLLLTGFYDGNVLKMINACTYRDQSKTESDEYLNETGVIMIFAKEFEYIVPLSVDPKGNTKSITENWYYFNHEDLIKWVSGGKVINRNAAEFLKKMEYFRTDFTKKKELFGNVTSLKKIK